MPWKRKRMSSWQIFKRAIGIITAIIVLICFAIFYWFIDKGAIGGQ